MARWVLGLLPPWYCLPLMFEDLELMPYFIGHAGAMLQARQLGNELVVGIHSDEDIMENKGPTVMNLAER